MTVAVFILPACDWLFGETVYDAVEQVTLQDSSLRVRIGTSKTLQVSVLPASANQAVTWISNNPAVVSVENGTITALRTGTATIRATSVDNPNRSAAVVITVYTPSINIVGDRVSQGQLTLAVGDAGIALTASILNAPELEDGSIEWFFEYGTASPISVQEDYYGIFITPTSVGSIDIIAFATVGSDLLIHDTLSVTVVIASVSITGVGVSNNVLNIATRDNYIALTAEFVNGNALANQNIIWSTSDSNIVAISSGSGLSNNISPVSLGTVTITATAAASAAWTNPIRAALTVTVVEAMVESIVLARQSTTIRLPAHNGVPSQVSALVLPLNAHDNSVTWTSGNTDVVVVNPITGIITPVSGGTAVLTVRSNSNPEISATTSVTIVGTTPKPLNHAELPSVRITTTQNLEPHSDRDARRFGFNRQTWTPGATFTLENAWCNSMNVNSIDIDVRGRGNSSWWQAYNHGQWGDPQAMGGATEAIGTDIPTQLNGPYGWGQKFPFRIRFGSDQSDFMPFLDSGYASRHWSFISSLSDPTLMRHYLAYQMGGHLGTFASNPFTRFVHVYINDDYRGVYMVTDHMNNCGEGNRANVMWNLRTDPNPSHSEFYIEMCNRAAGYGGNPPTADFWFRAGGRSFEIREDDGMTDDPAHNRYERTQDFIDYVRTFTQRVHDAIVSRNWSRIEPLIDVDSFVDWFIAYELFREQDMNFASNHMTIRGFGEDRRMHKGPLWDFDLSLGNGSTIFYPDGPRLSTGHIWFSHLVPHVPQFRQRVIERFSYVRENIVPLLTQEIRRMAIVHEEEFARNFVRWPRIIGYHVWHKPVQFRTITTFEWHIEFIVWFLETRANWMAFDLGIINNFIVDRNGWQNRQTIPRGNN